MIRHTPKLNFKKFNSSLHGQIKGVARGRKASREETQKVTSYLTYLIFTSLEAFAMENVP